MWEKSRFKNFTEAVSSNIERGPNTNDVAPQPTIPTWANASTNDTNFVTFDLFALDGFKSMDNPTPNTGTPFSTNPNLVTNSQPNGIIKGASNGAVANCLSSDTSLPIIFNQSSLVSYFNLPQQFNTVDLNWTPLNQWFKLLPKYCEDADIGTSAYNRALSNWDDSLFMKIIGVANLFNFFPYFKVGYYQGGNYYNTTTELANAYEEEFPTGYIAPFGNMVVQTILDNNEPLQTVAQLQNYIQSQGVQINAPNTNYLNTIFDMPDLGQLTNALSLELQTKGASLTEANSTVTNALTPYFEAVEFASEQLNTKQNELEDAYSICDSGNGVGGACDSIPQLSTEVSNLRDDIDRLESVETIKSTIDNALSTIAGGGTVAGGASLGDASTDIVAIQNKIAEDEAEISNLDSQIQAKETQIDELEEAISSVGSSLDELENDFIALNQEIGGKNIDISNLTNALTALQTSTSGTIASKQSEINNLTNEINTANQDLVNLNAEKINIQQELITSESNNADLVQELNLSNGSIVSLQQNKVTLENEIASLTAAGTVDDARISELESDLLDVNDDLEIEETANISLRAELLSEKTLTANQSNQISSLNSDVLGLISEKTGLENDIVTLNAEIALISTEKSSVEEQLLSAQQQGSANTEQYASDLEAINIELSGVVSEKNTLTANLSNANSEIQEKNSQITILAASLLSEQGLSSDLQNNLTTAISEKATLQGQFNELELEKQQADLELVSLENDIGTLESFLDGTISETNALTTQIQAETSALVSTLARFGYEASGFDGGTSNFSSFRGGQDSDLINAVRMAGRARAEYLNFKGSVVQNDYNKNVVANTKLNFGHKSSPSKKVTFRADGADEKSFEEKYGTLGKVGIVAGLVYLFTKK